MIVIPAIDLKDGRCVRLRQGRMDDVTLFDEDPVAVAERWVAAGCRRLHVVDLDGAGAGRPVNHVIIREICKRHPDLAVQVGGGIRDEETIDRYLDDGARYVILGTKAVTAPHFVADVCVEYPGHIIVGLDAKDGKVAVDGWSKLSHHDVFDLAQQFERDGVEAIVYTDIARDGMMGGPNVESTAALARSLHIPIIASGGISQLDDVRALAALSDDGIMGMITGRALYEGTLDLAQAQALADELTNAH